MYGKDLVVSEKSRGDYYLTTFKSWNPYSRDRYVLVEFNWKVIAKLLFDGQKWEASNEFHRNWISRDTLHSICMMFTDDNS